MKRKQRMIKRAKQPYFSFQELVGVLVGTLLMVLLLIGMGLNA